MNSSLRLVTVVILMLGMTACVSNRAQVSNADSPAVINAKLGLGYLQQGNYDVALTKLQKALAPKPSGAQGRHQSNAPAGSTKM